jgi:regulatory protein
MAETVPPADPEAVARSVVLRRLTAAPRTRAELQRSLRDRFVPDDVAATVLDRFTELGLINDVQYAESFTESRRLRGGWSRRAIAAKLSQRGVPRDIATDALAQVSGDDELHTALDLARRRWSRGGDIAPAVKRRRLAAMLARRGYSASVVGQVLARVDGGDEDVDGC